MGSYFSQPSAVPLSPAAKQSQHQQSLCNPKYDSIALNAIRDIQNLTPAEMEKEFEQLCISSSAILKSLRENPCEHISQRIAECLDSSKTGILNCVGVMGSYQTCVAGQVSKRIEEKNILPARKERSILKHVENVGSKFDK